MNGTAGDHTYYWLHRLYSLTGFVFAASFVLFFLVPYSSIFGGDLAFNSFMARIDAVPLLGWAQFALILVPLVFHTAMGVMIVYGSQINVVSYGYYRNWMYALQRLAGLALIPFVSYHIYSAELAPAVSGRAVTAGLMFSRLSSPWVKGLYLAGVASAAFYFGNGLAHASRSWGIAASRRSRGAFVIAGWMITLLLAFWGVKLVLSLQGS
ncbi:MAG: hypothetical protein JXA24_00515 [Proteobacteria bacterium]|nr:hypothetical protein [Pseudomonadota bacterium]